MGANGYHRKITHPALVRTCLDSFLLYVSGLRYMVTRFGPRLGTKSIGALSQAFDSAFHLKFCYGLLEHLCGGEHLGRGHIVAIDSMAVSIPKTCQHNCAKMNNATVGIGVLWGFCLTATRAISPIIPMGVMHGAWHDGSEIRKVELEPDGPLYLMDRGFYVLDLIHDWLENKVRFIMRGRRRSLCYEVIEEFDSPRRLRAKMTRRGKRTINVSFDGIVQLGSPKRRGKRPIVRMLITTVHNASGTKSEELILVTHDRKSSAQEILDTYGRRWEIEEFHRLLKETIGLAHLYSFRERGMEYLLAVATLLAVLLWLDPEAPRAVPPVKNQRVVAILREIIKALRETLGLGPPWRANTKVRKSRSRRC